MTNIEWLQNWYESMCDHDWEHQGGLKIDTLDNPGWSLKIPLSGFSIDESRLPAERKGDVDWFFCRVREGCFEAYGGPKNLNDLIGVFRDAQPQKTNTN